MTTKKNLPGVRPLGGKTSMGESVVVRRETRKLKVLSGRVRQAMPVSSMASAALYRKALVRYNPRMARLFRDLKLPY